MKKTITRRKFLDGTGLTLAVATTPAGLRFFAGRKADIVSGNLRPSVWVSITADNKVTVFMSKSEMGQGIHTTLPMIVAEELDADWDQVQIEMAPVTDEYSDPVWNSHLTAGSSSTRNMYGPLRKAGAAGREMLLQAAAQKWNVAATECETSRSQVHHKPTGRVFSYGELCEEAARLPVPENPKLKQESEFKLMGTSVPRRDIPAKVNGQAQFGTDTFLPDMLYAVLARPPAYGAKVVSFDEQAAGKVAGVRQVVATDRGIAVCADTIDACWKGREALNVEWGQGIQPNLSTKIVDRALREGLDKQGISARNDGDVKGALGQAHKQIQAEYFLPYLSHATMEPMNCTAHVRSDRCDIWAPMQSQSRALQKAVQITGLKPEQVHVHTTYLGGGFGRRGQIDFVDETVQIAKATDKPVKVIWSREEDMQYGFYRPGNSCRIEGAIDEQGQVTGWSHKVVAPKFSAFPTPPPEFLRELVSLRRPGLDLSAVSGIANMQYQIPNLSVEYVKLDLPIPVTFWRSVGDSHNGFTVESFMDELAYAAKRDPLEFRLQHLKHHMRAHRVLEVVAEKAGWGKPLTGAQGRGIASYHFYGTYVAQVAEVSVDQNTGKIRVHRVVCAVDCGPVVHPDTVVAQIEGAIMMGLSASLKEKIEFANGGVQSANFSDYQLLRISEAPDVEVHIVDSDGDISGIGEPGMPPVAPALTNAVFSATGARIRRLPAAPEAVLEAIAKS